tara:strand:+ start:10152 stop:11306 length:1155 start_codon:yes stop_codon:yes gene_type:complete
MKKYKKYKKDSKKPKAEVGTALLAAQLIPSAIQLGQSLFGGRKAREAEANVDKSKLNLKESKALTEFYNEPLKQSYLEKLDEASARDFATSIGSMGDDRAKVGLFNRLQQAKGAKDLQALGLSQQAREKALQAKANFDTRKGMFEAQMTAEELKNIGAAKGAAQQSLMNVAGDVASAASAYADWNEFGAEKGGYIEAGEGGVTEGEFDHDSNPIDIVQDGEKKGEMTGGELIVPPSDVDDIRKALDSGDAEQAMDLMKALVAKYDDNAMEVEEDKAEDGGVMTDPPTKKDSGVDMDRAQEIVKIMKESSDLVRNLGELPFDTDPSNPAGLLNFMNGQLSFDIDSSNVAEIDFIKNYREFMVEKQGRTDVAKMKKGSYIPKKLKY